MPTCPICKREGALFMVNYEKQNDAVLNKIRETKPPLKTTYACRSCLGGTGLGEMPWPPPIEPNFFKSSNR